jgi:toxin ParE1/3/4
MPSWISSACEAFSKAEIRTPRRALAAVWRALENLHDFPDAGTPTADPEVRQLVVRFGRSGYVIRYTILAATGDIFVARLWHGREVRE